MHLKDWLTANRVTVAAFARKIGRSSETVRRYTVGDRIPDRLTMPIISEMTGGEVTANDFFAISASPNVVGVGGEAA